MKNENIIIYGIGIIILEPFAFNNPKGLLLLSLLFMPS